MKKLVLILILTAIVILFIGCPGLFHKAPELDIPDQTVVQGSVLEVDLLDFVDPKEDLTFEILEGVGEIVSISLYRYSPGYIDPDEKEVKIRVTDNRGNSAEDTFTITILPKTYDVTLLANPPEGGEVTGEGAYDHGEEVEVEAIPNTGWEFVEWTEDGEFVSDDRIYTFEVVDDRELVANFTLKTYTLTVTIEGEGTVTKDPDKEEYTHGEVVQLEAEADPGWKFVKWVVNEAMFSTNRETTLTMNEDKEVKAYFLKEDQTGFSVIMVTSIDGLGDMAENDRTWEGIVRAGDFLGIEYGFIPSYTVEDYVPNLSAAAAEADVVFAIGYLMEDALFAVAPQFPDTHFVGIDISIPYDFEEENVAGYLFKEHEAAFLVGYVAAAVTKSELIGFIGGIPIPPVERYRYGYEAATIVYEHLHGKAVNILRGYTMDFDDPNKGKDLALAQFAEGADIIFQAAGACGIGVIEAATELGEGYFAIGVDVDQDYMSPGNVLTSSIKRFDIASYYAILSVALGTLEPGTHILGVADEGVGISEMHYTRHLVQDRVLEELDFLIEEIKRGVLVIPNTQDALDNFVVPDITLP